MIDLLRNRLEKYSAINASDKMLEIHAAVAAMSSTLLATVLRVISYADTIIKRFPESMGSPTAE